jgi:hypothetical protein
MKNILYLPVLLLTISCQDNLLYWEMSQFTIQESALADKEEIKILYSLCLPPDRALEAYSHFVVRSVQSGDTINILSVVGTTVTSGDEVYNFLPASSSTVKNLTKTITGLDVDSIAEAHGAEGMKSKDMMLTKVLRDKKFDDIANNSYPTVFGAVGKSY